MEGFLRQFNLSLSFLSSSDLLNDITNLTTVNENSNTSSNSNVYTRHLSSPFSSSLSSSSTSASTISTTTTTTTTSTPTSISSPTISSSPSILRRRLSHGETSCLEMAKLYNKNELSLSCQEYFQRVENIIYQCPTNHNEKISPITKSLNKKMIEHIKRLDSTKHTHTP